MQNVKSIAVIGVSEKRNLKVLQQLSEHHQILLFDKNPTTLSEVYNSLLAKNRFASIEKMDCPIEASWEADIIILSDFCTNDSQIVQKIKEVATAKVVIIMENDDEFTKSINQQLSYELVFPHSKIVEVINLNLDNEEEFLLEGHDLIALNTVSYIFEGMGFNTYVSQLH